MVWLEDFEMGIEAENFFLELFIEAAHDADDDNEDGDAERHAENGDQRNDGNERSFGPQIPQRQQQFKRQARHVRQKLDG